MQLEVQYSMGGRGACSPKRFERLHFMRFEGCALFTLSVLCGEQ